MMARFMDKMRAAVSTGPRKAAAATLGAAMVIAVPFISIHEGERLQSYQDVAGVWTICRGETLGVQPGQTMTKAQCAALTENRVAQFMNQVYGQLKVEVTPETLAAHTSFAYNIGIGGYARSTALKKTNAGDYAGGCRAMGNWYMAGGKDCRVRANRCYGLIERRNSEVNLCLKGIKK